MGVNASDPDMSEVKSQRGWLEGFKSSDKVNYLNFNHCWFEYLEDQLDDVAAVGNNEERSAMRHMVESWGENEHCRPEAEVIENVLGEADVQILRNDRAQLPELKRLLAMVDDRGSQERHQMKNRGPQTAHGVYRLLKREV